MIKRILSIALLAFLLIGGQAKADEGMWLPLLVKRLNYEDMQKKGLKLTAEEIYDINNGSLKDAIVSLGGFCTGEIVSDQGLMLTNHHCAFGSIQEHSSVDHDYLTDGFWAKSKDQELKNDGLTATILVRMEDVSEQVLKAAEGLSGAERTGKIRQEMKKITDAATEGNGYDAYVRSFFAGNEYYLFVNQVYKDVRLVGAPPSSIGKFGGDTDNWMWPRHTGDFSLFRIYTAPDGSPAEYAKENVPLKPKHHLPISLQGVDTTTFAMVFGYPGRTQRYLSSFGMDEAQNVTNPARVKLRERRLAIMKEGMDADPATRIKYASKYAQVSNYYKYFQGQTAGLKRLKTGDVKRKEEAEFQKWANADPERKKKYGKVVSDIKAANEGSGPYALSNVYLNEAAFATEIILMSYYLSPLKKALEEGKQENIEKEVEAARARLKEHFKDYDATIDKNILAAMMAFYAKDIPESQQPEHLIEMKKKYKGDWQKYAKMVFDKSVLASEEKAMAFLDKPSSKKINNDPAFEMMESILNNYRQNIATAVGEHSASLSDAEALYIQGLREMNADKSYYPDANSTLRLSYGTVEAYEPRDGVKYKYYTTIEGILEKMDQEDEEFKVPQKLIDLILKKDYGQYANEDGEMVVNFITNNDITGGNSGSPVIDGKGRLIGTAFDGNWEAMTGDLVYDSEYKRCINVDVRYVLFIIDKFAGATNLIQEMDIVK